MKNRRPRISLFLLICAGTLLVAIVVGERMGERVIRQATETAVVPSLPTPSAAASAETSAGGLVRDWKKTQIVTVATDPGFPDPRVTKPPTPTPTPRRTPTPTPTPSPTPTPIPLPTQTSTPLGSPTPETTRPPR